jgi:hypothetical protein
MMRQLRGTRLYTSGDTAIICWEIIKGYGLKHIVVEKKNDVSPHWHPLDPTKKEHESVSFYSTSPEFLEALLPYYTAERVARKMNAQYSNYDKNSVEYEYGEFHYDAPGAHAFLMRPTNFFHVSLGSEVYETAAQFNKTVEAKVEMICEMIKNNQPIQLKGLQR